MTTFYGDLETFSETPIKHGTYRYAEDSEILLFTWALDDGPIRVLDYTHPDDFQFDARVEILKAALDSADEVVFHNSMFDRTVLRMKAPALCPPIERWRCTMAQALAHGLPGALEKLCVILDVPHDKRKMKEGKALIQLFCKPLPKNHKLRRATRETHPADWAKFVEYATADVEAMRFIHRKLPTWNYRGDELALWHRDQRINDRGIAIDAGMAEAAIRSADRVQKRLAARTAKITGGAVGSTTQRDALLAHLLVEYGVDLPDMKGDTIERRIHDPELPWQVKELLGNRLEASRASIAKYKAMLRAVNSDGRVRGTLQFAGAARTGRWAGRVLQPQNFARTPKYLASQVEFAAEAIKADAVDLFYDKPLEVLTSGVPWAIIAPPGKKLCVPDLSNIEGRVLAWQANEQWKLDAFRRYDEAPDDKTRDLYIIGYAKSFKEAIEEVVKDYEAGGKKRQIGKVQELALGYQGLVGAFVSMAAVYGIDLNVLAPMASTIPYEHHARGCVAWENAVEQDAELVVSGKNTGPGTFGLARDVYIVCHAFGHMWRAANPHIVQFWFDLERAVRKSINSPGEPQYVGPLHIRRDANWLRIILPSGRSLCYPSPKVSEDTGKISYMGMNQYTKRWQRIYTYGGKLAENTTQAISRDVFVANWPEAEDRGYEITFHVHDEPVTETPDADEFSADELGAILCKNPAWAEGLPLAVGGYESHRYRKD